MKNYDKLKKIIQEANPEIMELQSNCEVKSKKIDGEIVNIFWETDKYNNQDIIEHVYILGVLKNDIENIHGNLMYDPNNYKPHFILYSDIEEIIGRSITFADVLLAMKKRKEWEIGGWAIRDDQKIKWLLQLWDLKQDIDNQTDETKQFLIDRLVLKQ